MLTAASPPKGKSLDATGGNTPHLSPIRNTLDAVVAFIHWSRLVSICVWSPPEAATLVSADRLPGDNGERMRTIQSIKADTGMRLAAFITGSLPTLIKLWACKRVLALQVFGSLFVAPWLAFELLIWASTTNGDSLSSAQTLEANVEVLRTIGGKIASSIHLGLDLVVVISCLKRAWYKVTAVGMASAPQTDILVLLMASCLCIVWIFWGGLLALDVTHKAGIVKASKHRTLWIRQVYSSGGAMLLGITWVPLLVFFLQSPRSFEHVAFVSASGMMMGIFLEFSFEFIFWKKDRVLGSGPRTAISLVLHIFLNHRSTYTRQPSWFTVLG